MIIKDICDQTGIIETYHTGEDGKVHVKKQQDVSRFIEANKQDMAMQQSGFKGHFHKMASIPPIVIEMWTNELRAIGADCINPLDKKNLDFLKRKLNSPEWNALRTKQGVI
jgi:hypothetical protein